MFLQKYFLACSICYILKFFSAQTFDILKTKPRNIISVKGNRIELKCGRTTNDNAGQPLLIDWDFILAGESGHKQIYFNGNFYQNYSLRYAILRNKLGQFDLVINNVDLSHAGTYECRLRPPKINANSPASAELVVLDSDLKCSANFLNETEDCAIYVIQCSVNYVGNAKAITECSVNDSNSSNNSNITMNSTRTKDIRNITSSITTSTLFIAKLQNTTFICNVTFISTNQNASGNAFEYVYTWTKTLTGSNSKPNVKKSSSQSMIVYIGLAVGFSLMAIFLIAILFYQLCKPHATGFGSQRAEPDILMQPSPANVNSYYDSLDENLFPHQNGCVPVYAEVKKVKATIGQSPDMNTTSRHHDLSANGSKALRDNKTTTGADGTVYMEINPCSDRRQFAPIETNRRPLFNTVETYVSIDHSHRKPPPPPF